MQWVCVRVLLRPVHVLNVLCNSVSKCCGNVSIFLPLFRTSIPPICFLTSVCLYRTRWKCECECECYCVWFEMNVKLGWMFFTLLLHVVVAIICVRMCMPSASRTCVCLSVCVRERVLNECMTRLCGEWTNTHTRIHIYRNRSFIIKSSDCLSWICLCRCNVHVHVYSHYTYVK